MLIWIAKIKARPAARPAHRRFDGDVAFGQACAPICQCLFRNREGEVEWTTAVVSRNRAGGPAAGERRAASPKEKQHAHAGNIVGDEVFVRIIGLNEKTSS